MIKCHECSRDFKPKTTRQMFCDKSCRNIFGARERTEKVQKFDNGNSEITIYEIICKKNDYRYIGCTTNIDQRWKAHLSGLRTGRHVNKNLLKDFLEFGEKEFELKILFQQTYEGDISLDYLYKIEAHYIKKLKASKILYNTKTSTTSPEIENFFNENYFTGEIENYENVGGMYNSSVIETIKNYKRKK